MATRSKTKRRGPPHGPWYNQEEIDRILQSVGKIPSGRVRIKVPDVNTGGYKIRRVLRSSAVNILLNQAAGAWNFESRRRTRPTEKKLSDALNKVQNSSLRLTGLLCPSGDDASKIELSEEIVVQLSQVAERLAAALGPYPQGKTVTWSLGADGEEIIFYGGEDQVHADIEAVARIAIWSKAAAARTGSNVVNADSGPRENRATNILFARIIYIWRRVLGKELSANVSAIDNSTGSPSIRFVQACLEPLGVQLTALAISKRIKKSQKSAES